MFPNKVTKYLKKTRVCKSYFCFVSFSDHPMYVCI